jgi:hypothetical protein
MQSIFFSITRLRVLLIFGAGGGGGEKGGGALVVAGDGSECGVFFDFRLRGEFEIGERGRFRGGPDQGLSGSWGGGGGGAKGGVKKKKKGG